MGIAASEARYLSLIARQSNCEFQGQHIEHAILNLSNKSSKLFSQMVNMDVPVPPSKTDFTSIQYLFTDESTKTKYTIKRWQSLVNDPDGCNYSITYTTNTEEESGNKTNLKKPGIEFELSGGTTYAQNAAAIREAKNNLDAAQIEYDRIYEEYHDIVEQGKELEYYSDEETFSIIDPDEIEEPEEEAAEVVQYYLLNSSYLNGYKAKFTRVGILWEKDGIDYTKSLTYPYTFSPYEGSYTPVEPTVEYEYQADISYVSRCISLKNQGYVIDTESVVHNADGSLSINFVSSTDAVRIRLTGGSESDIEDFYKQSVNIFKTANISYELYKYDETKTKYEYVKNALTELSDSGVINLDEIDKDRIWCYQKNIKDDDGNIIGTDNFFAFEDDLQDVINSSDLTSLKIYRSEIVEQRVAEVEDANTKINDAAAYLEELKEAYYNQNPTHIKNSPITKLSSLTNSQAATISKIIKNLEKQGIASSLKDCFSEDGTYTTDTYTGGIYTYTSNGKTYYVTYDDMVNSYIAGDSIEEQSPLSLYSSTIIPAEEEKAAKAYIQKSSSGRFVTIKFPYDTTTYALSVQEYNDEEAYEDMLDKILQDMMKPLQKLMPNYPL